MVEKHYSLFCTTCKTLFKSQESKKVITQNVWEDFAGGLYFPFPDLETKKADDLSDFLMRHRGHSLVFDLEEKF